MAKRGGRGGGFPGGGGGQNMQQLMKQAQKMQQEMMQAQGELETTEYSASVGGGVVSATVNGSKELLSLKISPEAVDPDDVEMLEDLVISAVKEAMAKADVVAQEKMGKYTNQMPGLF